MKPTPTLQFFLSPIVQNADRASDSSFILQTKSVSVVDRPRLEHLKYYYLAKLRPFQIPLIAALILLSLYIIFRKIKRKK